MVTPALVEFVGISKQFPNGTLALSDVSFSIAPGRIQAISGENGAGKSTLMKLLFGLERPSSGTLLMDGRPVNLHSPRAAAAHGIGMVHQHFSLVPGLTVAENLVLGNEPMAGMLLDRRAAKARVQALSQRFNLEVDPDALVGSLSVANQQKVEILKALSKDIRLLILDEPTAVLTPQETDELFARLRDLNVAGLTVLFISHKLREVRALASRVTVLRGGKVSGEALLADVSDADLTRLAMGRAVQRTVRDGPRALGEVMFAVRQLTRATGPVAQRVAGLSLEIRAGEILGIAGVDGSGQEGLVQLLMGQAQAQLGDMLLQGQSITGLATARRRQLGMAHLTADRFRDGGAAALELVDNAIAGAQRSAGLSLGPLLRRAACVAATQRMLQAYDVRCHSPFQPLGSLSGGNAQKLLAAREFGSSPKLLVVEQPTRGIDVLAGAFIHQRLCALAKQGVAILLLTADLDELLSLCDRVAVMHGGRIVARFDNHPELTPEHLGAAMLGLESQHA